MNTDKAASLYLELTSDIHAYWAAFGAVTVLSVGWLLSRKTRLRSAQRVGMTIGWFAAASYLASSLINRYRILKALLNDVSALIGKKAIPDSHLIQALTEYQGAYQHYGTIVWTSFGLISFGVLFLIWSNLLAEKALGPNLD